MLLALCSTYLEGPLAENAIRSALRATPTVVVFEGPAGPPLENADECPPTVIPNEVEHVVHGAWRTDAEKRTAMVEYCRRWRDFAPVWAVWIDGDEVLVNGEYLTDRVTYIEQTDDGDPPAMGWPMKLVEMDGSVTVCRGKVLRVDLVDSYSVSSSVFRNTLGMLHGEGNYALTQSEYMGPLLRHLDTLPEHARAALKDRILLPPPLPCEPFLVHRSGMRHPARVALRLHEQEASELRKARDADPALAQHDDERGQQHRLADPGRVGVADGGDQVAGALSDTR